MRNICFIIISLIVVSACQPNSIILDQPANVSFQIFDEDENGMEDIKIKVHSLINEYLELTNQEGYADFGFFNSGEYQYSLIFKDPKTNLDYSIIEPFFLNSGHDSFFEIHLKEMKRDLSLTIINQSGIDLTNYHACLITFDTFNSFAPTDCSGIELAIDSQLVDSLGKVQFKNVPIQEYIGYGLILYQNPAECDYEMINSRVYRNQINDYRVIVNVH